MQKKIATLIILIMTNFTMINNVYSQENMIETGVYKIPYIIPKSLEQKSKFFEEGVINAQKRLKKFAIKYGWGELVKESFLDIAEVYDNKIQFDQRIIYLSDAPLEIKLPLTYSAVLEKRVLISISPDLYNKNYPDGIENDNFEKLLTHELSHRLHVRVLNGDEEKMGPIWFFEGFAIYAANQFEGKDLEISREEVWKILKTGGRGNYKKYAAIMRYFLKKVDLLEMVKMAGDKNFIKWLEEVDNKKVLK